MLLPAVSVYTINRDNAVTNRPHTHSLLKFKLNTSIVYFTNYLPYPISLVCLYPSPFLIALLNVFYSLFCDLAELECVARRVFLCTKKIFIYIYIYIYIYMHTH